MDLNQNQATVPSRKKILWVEDDNVIAAMLGPKITWAGFDLIRAENGEVAIDMLSRVKPDGIVLDLILPGMSGFDVLERVSKDDRVKDVPVMVFSNLSKQGDWERVQAMGAKKFLVKASTSLDKAVAEIRELCK